MGKLMFVHFFYYFLELTLISSLVRNVVKYRPKKRSRWRFRQLIKYVFFKFKTKLYELTDCVRLPPAGHPSTSHPEAGALKRFFKKTNLAII